MKYDARKRGIIRGITRISKPGRRQYVGRSDIPRVRNGLGIAILVVFPYNYFNSRIERAALRIEKYATSLEIVYEKQGEQIRNPGAGEPAT